MGEALTKDVEQLALDDQILVQETPRYTYGALGGFDKIRTLKLHSTKERIECSIQHISVSDGGYQALSYVWGSPQQPFNAFVYDEEGNELGSIPLTVNLQAALCNLRDAEEVTNKVFWIDQICIHQEGEEKSHQVGLMGEIYRNAARVITYLGPAATGKDEEQRGIALLKRLHEHFSDNYELFHEAGSLNKVLWGFAKLPIVTLPEEFAHSSTFEQERYVSQGWRWLFRVAYGQWTQRLWIIQEQLLNKEIAMLHGHSLLSWDAVAIMPVLGNLGLLPQIYKSHFWLEEATKSSPGLSVTDIEESVYGLWHERKKQNAIGWKADGTWFPNLMYNMATYECLHCRDPR